MAHQRVEKNYRPYVYITLLSNSERNKNYFFTRLTHVRKKFQLRNEIRNEN